VVYFSLHSNTSLAMSTSVLVLGATGYIGYGVAKAFRRAGYKVYGVTRTESSRDQLVADEIIPIISDITKPQDYKDVILSCSIIVDGANIGKPSREFFDYVLILKGAEPVQTYKTLYIFTSGIMTYYPGYFMESLTPIDETLNAKPTDPREMVPKKELEDYILSNRALRTVVIRPGFVYGGTGGVIAKLFFDVEPNSKALTITGRPDKRWSWVHVDDLGDGYVKVAKAGSVADYQLFNITAQDNPTFEELKLAGARVAGWKGSKSDIKYEPVPADAYRQQNWETNCIINPQKAYDLLGWKPQHVGVLNEFELYYASWKVAQKQQK